MNKTVLRRLARGVVLAAATLALAVGASAVSGSTAALAASGDGAWYDMTAGDDAWYDMTRPGDLV